MMYSNTGVLGLVTGVGSDRQLYYWLIPNRNTDQQIGIAVLVRSMCVDCTKGLKCGGNRRVILGGAVCEEASLFRMGLLGLVLVSCGVGPSAV